MGTGGSILSGVVGTAARELPIIIAGAGPAGAATAIGLERAGRDVLVFEQRGAIATRARNIFLRPQARDILHDLTGWNPGRDTTIMSIENTLREAAAREGVAISYNHRVLDLVEHEGRISVTVEDAVTGARHTLDADMFVDATGGRLAATGHGALERIATGPSHVYVTAQYTGKPPLPGVSGAFDRARSEGLYFYPSSDGKGFIAYFDLPPGIPAGDESALLARYEQIASSLELGTPLSPPQVFDAQQHLSRSAAQGRVLKIGDSAGNADPYVGAGVAAALVDAAAATRALSSPGDAVALARAAADDVLEGHRNLGRTAGYMRDVRSLALRLLPDAPMDASIERSDLRRSRVLEAVASVLTTRPIS